MRKALTLAGGALSALHGSFQDTEGQAGKQASLNALAQEDASYTTTLVAPLNADIDNLYAGHRSHSSHYSGSGGSYRAPASTYTPPASTYRAPAPSPYVAPAAPIRSTPSTIQSAPRRTVSSPTRTYQSPNASDYELPSVNPATSDYSTGSGASLAPTVPAPTTPQSSWRRWADRDTAVPTDTSGTSTRASADQLRLMIMRVQAALYAKGYDPGAIDGVLSERTVLALRQFQEAYGLVPTGRMTTETLNALGVALVR